MPGSAADPVRLDHYQSIIEVGWPSGLYVQLSAQFNEIGSRGWTVAQAPATDLATPGVTYAGSFRNLDIGNRIDDFLFETFSVFAADGGLAGDKTKVSISGQAAIGLVGVGPVYTTEDVAADTVATQSAFTGGTGNNIGIASGRLKDEYSGTPVGLVNGSTTFFSDFYQEQVTIRAESLPIEPRKYWDLDAAMPLDSSVLFLGVVGSEAGECSHFNPISGVTVTYDGRPCTFVASFADWQAVGPPVGTHIYRAVFKVEPP